MNEDVYPTSRWCSTDELEKRYRTTDSLQKCLKDIYEDRDKLYLDDRTKRIELLRAGSADLSDALRREQTSESLAVPFARVVARIFCVANSINDVLVSEGMMMKYPREGCAHCGQQPCECPPDRNNASLGKANVEQSDWGLRQWQAHLDNLYGESNTQSERGIWFTANRVDVEITELSALEEKVPTLPQDAIRTEYKLELADVMAWTMATANIVDVDLHAATLSRFGNGCSQCARIPCKCAKHNFQQVKF